MPSFLESVVRPGQSLQRLAFVFVVLVILSIIGLDIWQAWTARRETLRMAETTISNLTRSLAQHAEDVFEEADLVLANVVERVETDGTSPAQLERLRRLLQGNVASLAQLNGLFVFDRNGNWLVTSEASEPPAVNSADRNYFTFHKDNPDSGVHIGAVIRSRSTGRLVLPVSRRINAPDGSFAGVALAALRVDYFRRFYDGFDIDGQGAIVLALRDGTLLVRRPYNETVIGSSLASGRIFSELMPLARSGTVTLHSMVDGVERLYGYRALDKYPLVVEAAQSRQAVLAPWEANIYRSAYIVALMIFTMGIFGIVLIRQIRHGMRAEAQLQEAHRELRKLALQDGLTGLANRRRLDQALPDEIARARRNGKTLGLIMLDIDHFKGYNDLYGHPAGDACIKAVGRAIQMCAGRAGDLAVRYGGEEFLVLLPETDAQGSQRIAAHILQAVRDLNIPHTGNQMGIVTISAGVHSWRPGGHEPRSEELLQAADQALYAAKAGGRNRVFPESA